MTLSQFYCSDQKESYPTEVYELLRKLWLPVCWWPRHSCLVVTKKQATQWRLFVCLPVCRWSRHSCRGSCTRDPSTSQAANHQRPVQTLSLGKEICTKKGKGIVRLISLLISSARQRSWVLLHMVPLLAKYWQQKRFKVDVWSWLLRLTLIF